jgi:uncharacterized protein YgbK (DUF1537 family)
VSVSFERAARRGPAVVAVDAETVDDLALVLEGLQAAQRERVPVITRCAPTFAALLAGGPAPLMPVPQVKRGLLIVVGSYVDNTTKQLDELTRRTRLQPIEVDVFALASDSSAEPEMERLTRSAARSMADHGVALLATPRQRPGVLQDLDAGSRIARNLALVAGRVEPRPDLVLTKGGITSAVTIRHGFEVRRAHVEGPVSTGISHWRPDTDAPTFLVFPGNVGGPESLAELVEACAGNRVLPGRRSG